MTEKDRFLGQEIKKAANCIRRKAALVGGDCSDITEANGWLIMYIFDHKDKDVFQKDIENVFSIRGSTSSNIISLMEKKGYIERVPVEYDARLKKLVLTQKAVEQCGIIQSKLAEFEKKMTQGISEQELEIFYSVLDRITANIE